MSRARANASVAVALIVVLTGFGAAPFDDPPAQAQQASTAGVFHGVGTVTAINRAKGWLTIDHEAIPGFMEAMEMMYRVEPPRLVDGVQIGDRIAFDIDGGREAIVGLKRLAPAK